MGRSSDKTRSRDQGTDRRASASSVADRPTPLKIAGEKHDAGAESEREGEGFWVL